MGIYLDNAATTMQKPASVIEAVAAAMDPDVVTFEPYYVEVEDRDDAPNNGETVVDLKHSSGKQPNCHVAMQVNQPRFVTMLKHMCEYYSR